MKDSNNRWMDSLAAKLSLLKIRTEAMWREAVGAQFDEITQSRKTATAALSHPEAKIRSVALQVLLKKWTPEQDVVSKCYELLHNDPDIDVRSRAMYYISAFFRGSKDSLASSHLAAEMLKSKKINRLVEAAYFSVLRIQELPIPRGLAANLFSDSRHEIEVDWQLVDQLFGGGAGLEDSSLDPR